MDEGCENGFNKIIFSTSDLRYANPTGLSPLPIVIPYTRAFSTAADGDEGECAVM
jgi:hypothetical protein